MAQRLEERKAHGETQATLPNGMCLRPDGRVLGRMVRAWGLSVLLGLVAAPTAALAQVDPCLDVLSRDAAALARYDAHVSQYLDARDAGDAERQVQELDALRAICDANLRLLVFRGDALNALGRCAEAAEAYLSVVASAPTWPHEANAADAQQRAQQSIESVGACIAKVRFTCATPHTTVRIGTYGARACDVQQVVPIGQHQVVAEAEGFAAYTKEYTFGPGLTQTEIGALTMASDVGEAEFVCADAHVEIELSGARYACNTIIALTPGARAYSAHYPVGTPHTGMVRVAKGERARVEIPTQVGEGQGTLRVVCKPEGAKVVVVAKRSKARRGLTCPSTEAMAAGAYSVEATLKGHVPIAHQVEVVAGAEVSVELALERAPDHAYELSGLVGYAYASTGSSSGDSGVGAPAAALEATYQALQTNISMGAGLQVAAGDALGFLGFGRLGMRWLYESVSAHYSLGLGYGTLGIPACDPAKCTDDEETPSLAWMLGGGMHIGISERLALTLALDYLSDFSNKAAVRLWGGVRVRL